MRRLPFTSPDSVAGVLPRCCVLVPEVEAEQAELRQAFAEAGVLNSLAFHKQGINGRLDFPPNLSWDFDGAIEVSITVQGQESPSAAWFWLVECDNGSGRKLAWWSMRHDLGSASAWS